MSAQERADGDCFIVALNLAIETGWTLCHGMVTRATDGLRHPHAWVERTDRLQFPIDGGTHLVISTVAVDRSNGHDLELPADAYRSVGVASAVVEYTADQARARAQETGHFGPWEDLA